MGSTRSSPVRCPGRALKRPAHVRRDPAAVEVAGGDALVSQVARLDALRIEGKVVAEGVVAGPRGGVRPRRARCAARVEVDRAALPLAQGGTPGPRPQQRHVDVVAGHVDRRRPSGLEHAQRTLGIGDGHAGGDDAHAAGAELDPRRAYCRTPDGFHAPYYGDEVPADASYDPWHVRQL